MGIFDRPKNYTIRSYETAKSYEERFQRLVVILNQIIQNFHNPLLNVGTKEMEKKLNKTLSKLKDNFEYCRNSSSANHRDLNELAKELRRYIFYINGIYVNESSKIQQKLKYKLTYDAKNWMIKINGEDQWYLGR